MVTDQQLYLYENTSHVSTLWFSYYKRLPRILYFTVKSFFATNLLNVRGKLIMIANIAFLKLYEPLEMLSRFILIIIYFILVFIEYNNFYSFFLKGILLFIVGIRCVLTVSRLSLLVTGLRLKRSKRQSHTRSNIRIF